MAERRNVQVLAILALVLTGMVARPLGAEMVYRFEPLLELSLMHDGNVIADDSGENLSDELAQLRAVLPLLGQSERTTWGLTYTPEAEFYNTYSDRDRLNHMADLSFNRTFSPRSNWEIGGAYLDTSNPYNDLLENDIIVNQSSQQMVTANTAYSVGVSSRVNLSFRYDYRKLVYDDSSIAGNTTHMAGISAQMTTGPRTAVGLDYAYQYFLYPDRGDYGIQNLLARLTARPSEQTTLTLAGGVAYQDYRAEDTGGGEDPAEASDTGFVGSIEWGRQGRRFAFDAGLDRRVRASGGIGQSVLSHSAHLSVSGAMSRSTSISLSGMYQRNEPTVSADEGTVDMVRSSLDFDYAVARHVELRFFADYIYQHLDVETQSDQSYPRVGLSVILTTATARGWAPTEN